MTNRAKPMNNAGEPAKNTPLTRVDDRAKEVEAIKQKLAAIEHERWSDWQKWCHKVINENIPYNKPLEVVMSRWDIQANKSYENLSKKEQASDMEQVDRYWPLIEEFVRRAEVEAFEKLDEYLYSDQGVTDIELVQEYVTERLKELRGEQ